MIGSLKGKLAALHPPWLLIEINGVGYEVQAPMTTIYKLPALNSETRLLIHHLVREDAQQLFGFHSEAERQLFRSLLKVTGIGARLALAILSGMEAEDFVQCIYAGDTARLTRLPGIGKKTAERLVIEMRDRLEDWQAAPATVVRAGAGAAPPDAVADAVSGLVALGYKPHEASRFVHAIDCAGMSSDAIIREVLKGLAKA
jgi:Holliday junction DNA helicase RuvA